MKILAIDTALAAVAVCVMDSGDPEPVAAERLAMERGHAEALLPLIDKVVSQVEGGFTSLGRVAVTVGPGSFTGLRVGISAARAIGLACGIPVVGVSTLAAFSAPLVLADGEAIIAASIDARHGQIYVQALGPGGQLILPPRLSPVREAVRALGQGRVLLCGSGASMMAIEAWSIGLTAEIAGDMVSPEIAYVARLGLVADPDRALPRPFYLKPPDAKPSEATLVRRPVPTA